MENILTEAGKSGQQRSLREPLRFKVQRSMFKVSPPPLNFEPFDYAQDRPGT